MTNFRKHSMAMALGTVTLSLALGGLFSAPQSASAKTKWTRYTPTALRGNWVSKSKGNFYGFMGYEYCKLTKDSFSDIVNTEAGNFFDQKKMYYHHKSGSQYYYVKGNAGYGLELYTEFRKSGNKIKARLYGIAEDNGKVTKRNNSWGLWMYKSKSLPKPNWK
ncbi:hypothetical protein [Secundilactobacillus muriivasis]